MPEINLTSKFSDKVSERFTQRSLTDAHAGHSYEFGDNKTIKIFSIDSVPVGDYTRSGANRFGEAQELGDTVQEMTMTQDKAFTFTVDHGNAVDQLNIKHAAQRLRTNWDEICTPMIDKYRFRVWMNGAGLGRINSTALTKATVLEAIILAGAEMSNKLVPFSNRTVFITQSLYAQAKLADQIVGIDKLGAKSITTGVVGEIDGMKVVAVPDDWFPAGVEFFIKYKNSTVDPMKLKTFRVHKNPPGLDGDLAECRFYHDAFVLGNKVNGLYVYAKDGMVATPTITLSGHSATIACTTNGAAIKYTTDGTDPKTSPNAQAYSSAVTMTAGQKLRCYASKAGLLNSGVAEVVDE